MILLAIVLAAAPQPISPEPDTRSLQPAVPIAPLQDAPDIVPLVPPPPEYTLSLRDGDWRVHVNFRPGEPQPGEVVELTFDVGRQKDSDVGEPQPFSDGKLVLTVTGPGPRARYLVRPLGDAGVYGVHWTPPSRGLWTLALAPYRDQGPAAGFEVGAGEPMPAASQGHMVQVSRMVVGAQKAQQPGVKQLMEELGRRWMRQIASPQPDPAELKAMARLLRAVKGRNAGPGFDKLAEQEAAQLDRGGVPDAASCLECHMRYRDRWPR